MSRLLTKPSATVLAAVLIAFGIFALGCMLRVAALDIRRGERTVTVKGLSERDVKADFVQYRFSFSHNGNSLPEIYEKIHADEQKVMDFLQTNGIAADKTKFAVSVADNRNRPEGEVADTEQYTITDQAVVNATDVDKVSAMTTQMGSLVQSGILIGTDSSINYQFLGLNSLKPDMLAEATKNARVAADKFAQDSNDHVGKIKRATQGIFSITAKGQTSENGYDDGASIAKTVHVVATVEYFLED